MNTDHESCEEKHESQPETESRGPLVTDLGLPSEASSHSDSTIKSIKLMKCTIRDPNQQVLVLENGVLKAVPDKGTTTPETFYISTSQLSTTSIKKENHIFLAVSKGELCLHCDTVKDPEHPSLQLKKKNIKELNSLNSKESLPFTFLKEQIGSYFTLESAANHGYFIYTSNIPRQPVGVTKDLGKEKNTQFEFENISVNLNVVQDGVYKLTMAKPCMTMEL
ncbi:interleukin-37 isoform X1 [Equus caballus]|uniref:interleukin-37 isoform X1 n=1 Tax=Equus caballus TaxID=9796 RepID=UPI0038B3205A